MQNVENLTLAEETLCIMLASLEGSKNIASKMMVILQYMLSTEDNYTLEAINKFKKAIMVALSPDELDDFFELEKKFVLQTHTIRKKREEEFKVFNSEF